MNQTLIKYTLILIFVGALAAGILALVYQTTLGPITSYQKELLLSSQKTVLPAAGEFKTVKMPESVLKKYQELYPDQDEIEFFLGINGGKICGVIFKVYPKGYAGPIKLLVGLDPDGKVAGLKVLEQKETPGLGNHIIDENFKNTGKPFVFQFLGKSAADKIQPKVDIDAITGATISSRAVSAGVRSSLELFELLKKSGGLKT